MRIILSGGGTGGHIYPALTIAKAIEQEIKNVEILFVGTKNGLEADIIPKEGYPIETIDVRGFERRLTVSNFINIFKITGSLWQSKRIIARFRPDLVIGTGGFTCGPILLMASLSGIPTMIQEQNVLPGVTNKILCRFVDKVALGYKEAATHFSDQHKLAFTGNPIRETVISSLRKEGIETFGLNKDKLTILVSGGSRGARSINLAMLEVYRKFVGSQDVQILHVTGQSEYNNIVSKLEEMGIDISSAGNVIIEPYLYNMPLALAAADLAVFRAGAIGLAELTARGIPSILIPYPYAAENHQEHNARALEKQGAAVVILDKDLSGTNLVKNIEQLVSNPDTLHSMSSASKEMGCPEAAKHIVDIALSLVKF